MTADVLLVSAPGCHLCTDAEAALTEMAREYPLRVHAVDTGSDQGRRVVTEHRPNMFPVVLVDGRSVQCRPAPKGET